MTCDKCPALIIESNESVYPPEFHCWYGDKYQDEHLEYFANLNEGCRKHLTTIERDMFGSYTEDWYKEKVNDNKDICTK